MGFPKKKNSKNFVLGTLQWRTVGTEYSLARNRTILGQQRKIVGRNRKMLPISDHGMAVSIGNNAPTDILDYA